MTIRKLAMPWAPSGTRAYCVPSRLLLTLALGEAPEAVPAEIDVSRGLSRPAGSLDGGPIDRILRRHAGAVRISRIHAAAASLGEPGRRHCRFDAIEQLSGVARSFRVELEAGAPLGPLEDALQQVTTVERCSPDYVAVTPFEAASPRRVEEDGWGARLLVRAADALAYEPGDPTVVMAVVDTGIAVDHPEVAGRFRAGFDTVRLGAGDVAPGVDILGDSRHADHRPVDRFVGHGMGCAGIMGALGIAMPPGLGGEAQLLPMRALGAAKLPGRAQPVGLGAVSDLDAACKLAVDLGAKVLNLSFGTDDGTLGPGSPKPHTETVRYAAERGCILVAASGNDGEETRYWPAAHPEVVAVGSVGLDRRPSRFTTRGGHVALCAPGEGILTAAVSGYQLATGTSFAAPFVAATCALLVARSHRRAQPIDGDLARRLLVMSAQPFAGGGQAGCGAGILDAAAALAALDALIDAQGADEPWEVDDG